MTPITPTKPETGKFVASLSYLRGKTGLERKMVDDRIRIRKDPGSFGTGFASCGMPGESVSNSRSGPTSRWTSFGRVSDVSGVEDPYDVQHGAGPLTHVTTHERAPRTLGPSLGYTSGFTIGRQGIQTRYVVGHPTEETKTARSLRRG